MLSGSFPWKLKKVDTGDDYLHLPNKIERDKRKGDGGLKGFFNFDVGFSAIRRPFFDSKPYMVLGR